MTRSGLGRVIALDQRSIDAIPDHAIVRLDAAGRVQTWNRGAVGIMGWPAAEVVGRPIHELYPPGEVRRAKRLLSEAARSDHATDEGWRLRAGGERFWAHVSITALRADDGSLAGYVEVTRDRTEGREAREALRRSEERYQRMVSEVQDYAILLLDPDGRVETWNRGAERIKGWRAEDIVGRSFERFYPPEAIAEGLPAQLLEEARRAGRATDEGWRVRADGLPFWAGVTITALHSDEGELLGFSKVTRDLTERRMAEETLLAATAELRARNDELARFAHITSHDLQEPLRTVSSLAAHLAEHYAVALDDEGVHTLALMEKAVGRMRRLIQDLLEHGRLGRDVTYAEVDCDALMADVLADLAEAIAESGARVEVVPLPTIRGLPSELRVLFQNLVANAIKFTRPGEPPRVTVRAAREPDGWRFEVRDEGIGIAAEDRARIFQIFQRLHGRDEYGGTGIGLAHVEKIARLHGGRVGLDSAVGAGTTFHVLLPDDPAAEDPTP